MKTCGIGLRRSLVTCALAAAACAEPADPNANATSASLGDQGTRLSITATVAARRLDAAGALVATLAGEVVSSASAATATVTAGRSPNGERVVARVTLRSERTGREKRGSFTFEWRAESSTLLYVCASQAGSHGRHEKRACTRVRLYAGDGLAGCSDGSREGFVDRAAYPDIAGCSGMWDVPGIHTTAPAVDPICGLSPADTRVPRCGRAAGNDGLNAAGAGCTVEDLCAPGWHVCNSAGEVATRAVSGCEGATRAGDPELFFATRQSSTGFGHCTTGVRTDDGCDPTAGTRDCAQTERTSNDIFGCGNFGTYTNMATSECAPLNRFSDDYCVGLYGSPWFPCHSPGGYCEGFTLTKPGPSHGGVLCCRDEAPADDDGDAPACRRPRGAPAASTTLNGPATPPASLSRRSAR